MSVCIFCCLFLTGIKKITGLFMELIFFFFFFFVGFVRASMIEICQAKFGLKKLS